jgi:hypothetical protein
LRKRMPYQTPLVVLIVCSALFSLSMAGVAYGQREGDGHSGEHGAAMSHDHHSSDAVADSWEGSAAGIAYSEKNHHFAGWMVVLMGLAEVSHVMRLPSLIWARFLLPSAMLFVGIFLMIWSDHEAWPVGHLSFAETFFGQDHEIVQHKFYGLLALAVGGVELFRRLGLTEHRVWATPLPLMAIIGGIMLFSHSHGVHPSAHKIVMHHNIMGAIAITAGSSKLFSGWNHPATGPERSKWEWLWAGLILVIGAQLLIYSE